jgi:hypothetical protein
MSNAAIIVLALIQHGPDMARAILTLFQKENPSVTDWEALFSTYKKPYEAYTAPILPNSIGTTTNIIGAGGTSLSGSQS